MQRETEKLKADLRAFGRAVRQALLSARGMVGTVERVDSRERQGGSLPRAQRRLQEKCLAILGESRGSPHDLRFVAALLKVSGELGQIGLLTRHITESAGALVTRPPDNLHQLFAQRIDAIVRLLDSLTESLVELDGSKAQRARNRFSRVDGGRLFALGERPGQLDVHTHLCLITIDGYLDQIAQSALNLADAIAHLIDPEPIGGRLAPA